MVEPSRRLRPERTSPTGAAARRGLVFLVDDDDDLRSSVAVLLEHEGYLVLPARDGREALARMQSISVPAVAVIDLNMPGLNGQGLARAMRDDPKLSHIPVIVVSGTPSAPIPGALMMRKPVSPARLLSALRDAMPTR